MKLIVNHVFVLITFVYLIYLTSSASTGSKICDALGLCALSSSGASIPEGMEHLHPRKGKIKKNNLFSLGQKQSLYFFFLPCQKKPKLPAVANP